METNAQELERRIEALAEYLQARIDILVECLSVIVPYLPPEAQKAFEDTLCGETKKVGDE